MTTYLTTVSVQLASKSYSQSSEHRVEASNIAAATGKAARLVKALYPRKKIASLSVKLIPLR